MNPRPTGCHEARDGHDWLVLTRTFRAPIDAVWAAVTEPDRLERWIGTWAGDPATGSVEFRMTAEGEDVQPETFTINACEPPRLLDAHSQQEGEDTVWHLVLELTEDDGITTLTFSQSVPNAELAASVGPGWEYYLDRLVATETGGDASAVDFGDYYPAQSDDYRGLFT